MLSIPPVSGWCLCGRQEEEPSGEINSRPQSTISLHPELPSCYTLKNIISLKRVIMVKTCWSASTSLDVLLCFKICQELFNCTQPSTITGPQAGKYFDFLYAPIIILQSIPTSWDNLFISGKKLNAVVCGSLDSVFQCLQSKLLKSNKVFACQNVRWNCHPVKQQRKWKTFTNKTYPRILIWAWLNFYSQFVPFKFIADLCKLPFSHMSFL